MQMLRRECKQNRCRKLETWAWLLWSFGRPLSRNHLKPKALQHKEKKHPVELSFERTMSHRSIACPTARVGKLRLQLVLRPVQRLARQVPRFGGFSGSKRGLSVSLDSVALLAYWILDDSSPLTKEKQWLFIYVKMKNTVHRVIWAGPLRQREGLKWHITYIFLWDRASFVEIHGNFLWMPLLVPSFLSTAKTPWATSVHFRNEQSPADVSGTHAAREVLPRRDLQRQPKERHSATQRINFWDEENHRFSKSSKKIMMILGDVRFPFQAVSFLLGLGEKSLSEEVFKPGTRPFFEVFWLIPVNYQPRITWL